MATAADYQGKALLNLKTPHAAQAEFLATDKKRITLNWGRRTGKSMGAGIKASMEAIMHQGTYYIIAPTIGNAQKIYWDEVLKTIFKDSPLVDQDFVKNVMGRKDYKEVGFNKNENSVTIDYIENAKVQMPDGSWKTINHDTTKPRSKIVLYGATVSALGASSSTSAPRWITSTMSGVRSSGRCSVTKKAGLSLLVRRSVSLTRGMSGSG